MNDPGPSRHLRISPDSHPRDEDQGLSMFHPERRRTTVGLPRPEFLATQDGVGPQSHRTGRRTQTLTYYGLL